MSGQERPTDLFWGVLTKLFSDMPHLVPRDAARWELMARNVPSGEDSRIYLGMRGYQQDTLHLMDGALDRGMAGSELRVVMSRGASETQVREHAEYAQFALGADSDESQAIVHGLHQYLLPEMVTVTDFTEASDRTKALCRSLIAATCAIHSSVPLKDTAGVLAHPRTQPHGESAPIIVHDGLLQLIRSHPNHGETIANFILERGLGGIEAARTALEDETPSALGEGVL